MQTLLPEYKLPFAKLIMKGVRGLLPAYEPLLGEIQTLEVDHLPPTACAEAQGYLEGEIAVSSGTTASSAAIAKMDLDDWHRALTEIAEQSAKQQMKHLLACLNNVSEKTDNVVDAQGAPLSYDLLLDMLEKMDFQVGDDGNPVGLTMIVSQQTFDQLTELGQPTAEQENRLQQIIKSKRGREDAKKRVRKLDKRSP